MPSKLSEMTTGVKSALLKVLDPLFKGEEATTVIPIKITGTTEDANVGLEMGPVFSREKSSP